MKRKKGKKKVSPYLTHYINLKVTPADWQKIVIKAQTERIPSSTWIRKHILELIEKEEKGEK